jgi:hypothetical protein
VPLIGGKCRKLHFLTVLASAAISIPPQSATAALRFLSAGPRARFQCGAFEFRIPDGGD